MQSQLLLSEKKWTQTFFLSIRFFDCTTSRLPIYTLVIDLHLLLGIATFHFPAYPVCVCIVMVKHLESINGEHIDTCARLMKYSNLFVRNKNNARYSVVLMP